MENSKKKYGFWTGLAMVIGTVLGSGVFIKASSVLDASGGNLTISLIAWLIGGIIMVASGFCFAVYASRIEKFNGCIDYIEHATNKTVGYYFGYYLAVIGFPVICSRVSLIGARYLVRCFTDEESLTTYSSYPVIIVAFILLTLFVLLNYLSPKISAKYQVSVLFIKIIPIVIIAVVGLFAPLINPNFPGIIGAFKNNAKSTSGVVSFGEAIKITAFAYDGWIAAASLNAEMKDSKKNLPRALIGGTIALVIFYLIYFISISAVIGNQAVVDNKDYAAIYLFLQLFGEYGALIFLIFIFLSCTGNVNSQTICTSRSLIALGIRGEGIYPEKIIKQDEKGRFSKLPFIISYIILLFYLLIWFLSFKEIPVFRYLKNMDEIVCAIIYGVYIVVYIYMMRNFKEENKIIRFVMPIIAIIGSAFFAICGMGLYQLIFEKNPNPIYSFLVFLGFTILLFIPAYILHIKNKKELNIEINN